MLKIECYFKIVGFINWENNQILRTITLDVNPSIELKINRSGKVKKVIALNDDAKNVVSRKMKAKSQEDVLENIIHNLWREGYFSKEENYLLVSVWEKNKTDIDVSTIVQQAVGETGQNVCVLYQEITDSELKKWKETEKVSLSIGIMSLQERINSLEKETSAADMSTAELLKQVIDLKVDGVTIYPSKNKIETDASREDTQEALDTDNNPPLETTVEENTDSQVISPIDEDISEEASEASTETDSDESNIESEPENHGNGNGNGNGNDDDHGNGNGHGNVGNHGNGKDKLNKKGFLIQ